MLCPIHSFNDSPHFKTLITLIKLSLTVQLNFLQKTFTLRLSSKLHNKRYSHFSTELFETELNIAYFRRNQLRPKAHAIPGRYESQPFTA